MYAPRFHAHDRVETPFGEGIILAVHSITSEKHAWYLDIKCADGVTRGWRERDVIHFQDHVSAADLLDEETSQESPTRRERRNNHRK